MTASQDSSEKKHYSPEDLREIYARGNDFGEFLQTSVETIIAETPAGENPYPKLHSFISNVAKNTNATILERFPDQADPEILARLEKLTGKQKELFGFIVTQVDTDARRVDTVIQSTKQNGRRKLDRLLKLEGTPPPQGQTELTPEEMGQLFFMSARSQSTDVLNRPKGPIHFYNRGQYIELEVESEEDLKALYQVGDVVNNKRIGGFFSKTRSFSIPGESDSKTCPMVVVWNNGNKQAIDKTRKHERGHYINSLVEQAQRSIASKDKSMLKPLLMEFCWKMEKMHAAYSQTPAENRDEFIAEYETFLGTFQQECFSRAKDELLADYSASGNFDHVKNLRVFVSEDPNALYDYYDQMLAGEWVKMPPDLQKLVLQKKSEYHDAITEQAAQAEAVVGMLLCFRMLDKHQGALIALL